MVPALLSVRWAMIPFFVSTAAACDFVAVNFEVLDFEEVVRVITEACWDGADETVVSDIQICETCQQPDFGRDSTSEVVAVEI